MSEDPFESAARELKRALQEHARAMREEMERAREQMRAAMERLHADMDRARAEFEETMAEARRQMGGPRNWNRPDDWMPSRSRRGPPRKPRGGEPAPVEPRPKPTPLVDGAEAPLD